jgi:putative acetyltransferase
MTAPRGARTLTLADGRRVGLRAAQPRDAAAVARLLDVVAAEPGPTLLLQPGERSVRDWRRIIRALSDEPRALLLLALREGEAAGQVALRPDPCPGSAHVCVLGIAVDPAWRRRGLGRALLTAALAQAAAAGYRKATLTAFAGNEGALRFYEACGFVREGLRRAHLRRGDEYHDEVLLARPLPSS